MNSLGLSPADPLCNTILSYSSSPCSVIVSCHPSGCQYLTSTAAKVVAAPADSSLNLALNCVPSSRTDNFVDLNDPGVDGVVKVASVVVLEIVRKKGSNSSFCRTYLDSTAIALAGCHSCVHGAAHINVWLGSAESDSISSQTGFAPVLACCVSVRWSQRD